MATTSNKQSGGLKDTYQRVTDFVLEQLDKGEIIWRKGWHEGGLPKNMVTGKAYRGWNVFWLNFTTVCGGYRTPYFITFKQAQALGGSIKKGEHGTPIVYWAKIENKRRTITEVNPDTGEESVWHPSGLVPKHYTVFNMDQAEGLDITPFLAEQKQEPVAPIDRCEMVIENMPQRPTIHYSGDRAYYVPSRDIIHIPAKHLFISSEELYCTQFHELGHATGHESRLNRKELVNSDGFGGDLYCKEELTAELTAAYLCAICGIEQPVIENSAAYIQGWVKALQNDKTLIIKAAAQAQKAAAFILGDHAPEETTIEAETAAA